MKKLLLLSSCLLILLSSCGISKDIHAALETKQQKTQDLLNSATVKLNSCIEEKASVASRAQALEEQIKLLKQTNQSLIKTKDDFLELTKKGAQNLETTLESLNEKDLQIRTLRDAITRKDSVTLALVTSLKGVLGDLNDQDIEVNVEKGVVFVSISDKLLFKTGSYKVSERAHEVLAKVAKVVNNKPDFEFMVEGHTDNKSIKTDCIEDNWDLSTKRATAIVRILTNKFEVDPTRITAAGRGEFIPVATNDTEAGRSANRRTKIIVLPKLDQFYNMIEEGMRAASGN
ncbi:MAG: OmpA family protein [Flavobacteriaceae bacterium]|nr:OmpA family protein [Flavobacteriaceae bacterium]